MLNYQRVMYESTKRINEIRPASILPSFAIHSTCVCQDIQDSCDILV